jgi:hypothetical protein
MTVSRRIGRHAVFLSPLDVAIDSPGNLKKPA